jgi:hypothetical protein
MRPDQRDLLARVGDLCGCRRDRAEPLRLRVWLLHGRVPFIGYHGLAEMEGLVQSVAVALAAEGPPSDALGGLTDDVVIPSPIEHMTVGGEPIACCSWGIPAEGANKQSVYVLRRRPEYDSFNLPRVQTNHGEHKALQVPISTLVTPYLDFYVRADRERLEALRPWMHTIGRGGAFSLGAILQVEIDEDAEDRSLSWRNRPQRVIPVTTEGPLRVASFVPDTYEMRVQAIRAPYWRPWGPHPLCLVPTPQALSEALPEAA